VWKYEGMSNYENIHTCMQGVQHAYTFVWGYVTRDSSRGKIRRRTVERKGCRFFFFKTAYVYVGYKTYIYVYVWMKTQKKKSRKNKAETCGGVERGGSVCGGGGEIFYVCLNKKTGLGWGEKQGKKSEKK